MMRGRGLAAAVAVALFAPAFARAASPPLALKDGSIVEVEADPERAPGVVGLVKGRLTHHDEVGLGVLTPSRPYYFKWWQVRSVNGVKVPSRAREVPQAGPLPVVAGRAEGFSVRLYGYLAGLAISDTTRSYLETAGNGLVQPRYALATGAVPSAAPAQNADGRMGRFMASVRASRLGLRLASPTGALGWRARGTLEMDFTGSQAVDVRPGSSAGGVQSEDNYFNKASIGMRHAFASFSNGGWSILVGQTNSLFGWGQHYVPSQLTDNGPACLPRRYAQARVSYSAALGDWTLETAAAASRPAEMNSSLPSGQAGVRLSRDKGAAAEPGRDSRQTGGASLGLSAGVYPMRTAMGRLLGRAAAASLRLPLLGSDDGKDFSNTVALSGEASQGEGYGVEFSRLTFGVPAITAASGSPAAGTPLDAGLAGLASNNRVELLRLRHFRGQLSWTLPGGEWTAAAGAGQAEALNLERFSNGLGTNGFGWGFAPKIRTAYAVVAWDPQPWARVGAQYEVISTGYNDPNNRVAVNHRGLLATFLKF